MGRFKQAWLTTIKYTFNPLTLRMARRGIGPFSLIRHVGRRSGATFETPLILARVPDGFVAELTYGAGVNWYRNVVAASHAVVVWHGREYSIDRIGPCPTEDGLRAFGPPASWLLRMLRRHEFRMLRESTAPPAAPSSGPA